MSYEETIVEFSTRESLITIKIGFTDSSHRKIRDGQTGFGRQELVPGEYSTKGESLSA